MSDGDAGCHHNAQAGDQADTVSDAGSKLRLLPNTRSQAV
jgi:hypothetical protein